MRPFGFLVGKDFFLSEAEEEEYREVTKKQERIDELKEKLAKGDLDKDGWGTGDYTVEELKNEIAQLEREKRDAASRIQKNNLA